MKKYMVIAVCSLLAALPACCCKKDKQHHHKKEQCNKSHKHCSHKHDKDMPCKECSADYCPSCVAY